LRDKWWAGFDLRSVPGLVAWYDASALTLADGAPVPSWRNLAGQGNDLVPVVAGAPNYKTNVQNGLGVVRFDGVDDVINAPSLTSYKHIFIVAAYRLPLFSNYDGLVGNTSQLVLTGFDGMDVWYPYEAVNETYRIDGVTATGNWPAPMARFGVISFARHTGTWGALPFQIGQDRNISGRIWDGDVAEVVVYDRVLSPAETQQVEAYLKAKWGTP
jgi:hypothetical protein